jgi:8-amino-7-oxononanoate synthase
MANAGLLSAIPGPSDIILYDSEVHASTKDGIRLSQAMSYAFRHNDVEHLEHRLRNRATIGDCFVCVESIYSTDGSQAPLLDICSLIKKYNAHLIVDEAHAVGVCGPQGRGLVATYNLTSDVFAQVVTFSKALGAHGAIVLGKQSLKQALINFANSFVYTTALPFSTLAAIKCSYDRFPYMDVERQKICDLIRFFQEANLRFSDTHIQYLPCASNQHAKKIANKIQEAGIDVRALLSPTVKRGNERLRICLHAFNTQNELKNMFKHLEAIYA